MYNPEKQRNKVRIYLVHVPEGSFLYLYMNGELFLMLRLKVYFKSYTKRRES